MILTCLAAFVLSLILTRLMIYLGPKLGFIDHPDERRVHTTPIPRAGGFAILAAFIGVIFFLEYRVPELLTSYQIESLNAFASALAMLVAVGIADDRWGIKPWIKLFGQIGAAALYWSMRAESNGALMGFEIPLWLDLSIWLVWVAILVNAFNLIDGLDGLCGGLAAISLGAITILQLAKGYYADAFLFGLMLACIGGFLWYNINPAKIFLGDTGSMSLGFFLGTLATETVGRKALGGVILLPLVVAGVPLLDVLLAVWRRSARQALSKWNGGESVHLFAPDKDHLHHRLLQRGWNQRKVAGVLHAGASVVALLALMPMIFGSQAMAVSAIGFFFIGAFGFRRLASVELEHSGSLLHLAIKRRRESFSFRRFYFLYDSAVMGLSAMFAVLLETNWGSRPLAGEAPIKFTIAFICVGLILLHLMNIYGRTWSRARLREFLQIALGVALAAGASAVGIQISAGEQGWSMARIAIDAAIFANIMILAPRAFPDIVREFSVDNFHRHRDKYKGNRQRAIVYGAGDMGGLYIDYLGAIPPNHFDRYHVVGFLDDNPRLHNRALRGFPILGGLEALPQYNEKLKIDAIFLTIDHLPTERMERLQDLAESCGIHVYEWRCQLRELG
jgi:UDP-N-acetylmuramyl pentapeptide phosphotransferase/UDP-N-acetylglucosamine-1-phosphate transferase